MNKHLFWIVALLASSILEGYDLPNNDAGCPANCRQIPWKAGSDLWNGGVLPRYPSVTCSGLVEGDGTVDNQPAIQNCIGGASANSAVFIPAGIYYLNGPITLKSNVVLRGAGAPAPFLPDASPGATTLKFGPNGGLRMSGSGAKGPEIAIHSGYAKGSTTLTVGDGHGLVSGDWVVIYEHPDPEIPVTWTGSEGNCRWCGESGSAQHLMTQIVQVRVDGNTLSLSRPMYYTFKTDLNPALKKLTFAIQYAGVEDIKLNGWSNARSAAHIYISRALFCWVRNVETYNTPDVGKAYPVYIGESYGNEIRDSYFHYGQGNGGDRNYGIGIIFPNSDHKIENNILRQNRHSISQEGGGSGNVFLYNYIDDNVSQDLGYVAAPYANHGAHPYMTLLEGNIISRMVVDNTWGSSSHGVFFRNWMWGDESGHFAEFNENAPRRGFVALELEAHQNYYSVVGNVLGNPNLHTDWSNANLFSPDCDWSSSRNSPTVYGFGCRNSGYSAEVWTTTIKHGNYDYRTRGVAHWDGGADHVLKPSLYYSSKPDFFGSVAWPPIGPDVAGYTNDIPAKTRYDRGAHIAGRSKP